MIKYKNRQPLTTGMDEIIRHITKSLEKFGLCEGECVHFPDKNYKAANIDKKNFHDIKDADSKKKIAFIDGGNAEIIRAANLSLSAVRVYYNVFSDNKKISSKKYELFVLLSAFNKDGKISYKTELFNNEIGLDKNDLVFDSFDATLKTGAHRVVISKIGDAARKFAELKAVERVIDELDKGDIAVMDRDLQASVTNEAKYFDLIYKKADEKGVIITGLCKSSNLLTNNGNPVNALLGLIGEKKSWFYYPVAEIKNENHKAEMFFVKLHEKSRHVLRFEVYNKQKDNFEDVLGLLKKNSRDPIFLGYPYGLIDADKHARVSNQEKEYQKTVFLAKMGKRLDGHLMATAHEILDNIS